MALEQDPKIITTEEGAPPLEGEIIATEATPETNDLEPPKAEATPEISPAEAELTPSPNEAASGGGPQAAAESADDQASNAQPSNEAPKDQEAQDDASPAEEAPPPPKVPLLKRIILIFKNAAQACITWIQEHNQQLLTYAWYGLLLTMNGIIGWILLKPHNNLRMRPPDIVPMVSMGILDSPSTLMAPGDKAGGNIPPYQRFASKLAPPPAGTPRLAIIIFDLGMLPELTATAQSLAPSVTLAYSPYAKNVETLQQQAYSQGHEILIQLPLEPLRYPQDDPGPATLLTNAPNDDNKKKLFWVMRKGMLNIGLLGVSGTRFTTDPQEMRRLFKYIQEKNYAFIDSGESVRSITDALADEVGLHHDVGTRYVDQTTDLNHINGLMDEALDQAKAKGRSTLVVQATPKILALLPEFLMRAEIQNVAIVPTSQILQGVVKHPKNVVNSNKPFNSTLSTSSAPLPSQPN